MKINEIKPVYVKYVPKILEEGILYISLEFDTASHLCVCGCGGKVVTPLTADRKREGWNFINIDGKVSLYPSIGNWKGENPYHAHYYIKKNKIEWL